MVMALLAVLLLLALVVAAGSATTSIDRDGNHGTQAMNANSTGGQDSSGSGSTNTSKRPLERIAQERM